MMRLNGLGPPPYTPFKNGGISPISNTPPSSSRSSSNLLSSSPAYGALSPLAVPETIPEMSATPSPTSSHSGPMLSASQENIGYLNTSTPSTPASTLLRRKPPPKPPRMRNIFESNGSLDVTMSPTPSIRSFRGASGHSLKTSLVEVTSTLDASICPSLDGKVNNKCKKQIMREKVFEILLQTKEFLLHEVNPEVLLEFIRDKGVISENSCQELKRQSRQTMCDMLLDVIMSKGRAEFLIFCESLRAAKQLRVAELLSVLDTLIETITNSDICGSVDSQSNESGKAGNASCELCSAAADNNNEDDIMYDSSYFDINISYYDTEACSAKTVSDVLVLKRQRKESLSDLVKGTKQEAERFIPMVSLSLYNQCLCGSGIDRLADILENHSCVQELSIAKNHLGVDGMAKLGKALEQNRSLVKLDIRLNVIGDQGARHLAEGLTMNTSLRSLNVTSTGLSGQGCNNLVQGLARNQSLMELDVGFNDLQDTGTEAISNILVTNSSLRRLRMRGNSILSKGSANIFRALRKNCRLAALDMSSNKIGNESISTLGEMLRLNRTLREINLENCNISQSGCAALARSLKTNTILKSLDLSINPLYDEGAEALSDGLKYNQGLEVMCLNQCGIGNYGFMALLESLKFNSTMTVLKLCYNKIGHDGIAPATGSTPSTTSIDDVYETLCRTLQLNQDLKVLLWGNKLDDAESEPIYANQEIITIPPKVEPDYVNLQSVSSCMHSEDDNSSRTVKSQSCSSATSDTSVYESVDITNSLDTGKDAQTNQDVRIVKNEQINKDEHFNTDEQTDKYEMSQKNAKLALDHSVWNENGVVSSAKVPNSAHWPDTPVVAKPAKPPRSFSTDSANAKNNNNKTELITGDDNHTSQNDRVETIV